MAKLLRLKRTEAEAALIAAARARLVQAGDKEQALASAIAALEANGLPTRRAEAYHYTDLRLLLDGPMPAMPAAPVTRAAIEAWLEEACPVPLDAVIAVGGGELLVLRESAAVEVAPCGPIEGNGIVSTLTTVLGAGTCRVRIKGGARPAIALIQAAGAGGQVGSAARWRIEVEAGAEATGLELLMPGVGASALSASEVAVEVAPGARLSHVKLVGGAADTRHVARADVRVGAGGHYGFALLGLSSRLVRQEADIRLEGEGAHAAIRGALLSGGEAHLDLTARIDHQVQGTTSEQDIRAVLAGGRAVVQGAVRVAPKAVRSDARQMIRGLLLSPKAELDAKPELEILADDVKCSHGTAIGDLDGDALFYLRSRGIGLDEARLLLIEAFLASLFEAAAPPAIGARLAGAADGWLKHALKEETHG